MLIPLGILNAQGAAAGGAAYDLLETQVLSSSASSVTFTGLGSYSDYKHLQVRVVGRGTTSATVVNSYLRVNGDTGANYRYHALVGDGSSVVSFSSASNFIGEFAGANSAANNFTAKIIDVLDFADTAKNTTFRTFDGNPATAWRSGVYSMLWINTASVTSLELYQASGNFVAGSRFSLYGVK